MKVYLAARYSRIDEINLYSKQLQQIGYEVHARWLLGNHKMKDGYSNLKQNKGFAKDDLEDIINSDIVICFTDEPYHQPSRGGRHVEFGMVLMWNYLHKQCKEMNRVKTIYIVGPRENVFYCLPQIDRRFAKWDDCCRYLSSEKVYNNSINDS